MRVTRTKSAFATMLAGLLLAAASPAIAHAQSPRSSDPTPSKLLISTSVLKNLKSGKVLQPTSTANGAKVVLQEQNSNVQLQRWYGYTYDGYYTWENDPAGRNLGVDGASTATGAAAIIATGSSDANQDWAKDYSPYDGNYYALRNRKSGKCLGISGASTANGAQAAQFPCDGSANQGWLAIE